MNLKFKVSISICLLLTVSLFIYSAQIPAAHAWGWTTHRFIETKAESVFSNNSFFSNNHNTLYFWCIQPDNGWGDSDWHYLDAYSYNPLVYTGGKLPWAMENIFENLVQKLQIKNWSASENLMGAICHFTADSTMPLHSTWNYNPKNQYNQGMHSPYEDNVNIHLNDISIPDNYVPQKLDNIIAAALASLAKSFIYAKEGANPGDNNLTAFLENNITWNDWIKSMTENRLRSAVQFTANVWYSAMIQAGLTIQYPTLTSPSNGSSTTDNTPTFTWTSVSGTSYYDFQLASDNNFTINARTVKGLTTNSYTPVNPLTNGGWYWHVRTGDNSADVGLWSPIMSFTVSASTHNPVVAISPSSQSGANGVVLSYTVTVNNTENVSDNFNLTASDNAGWNPTVSTTPLTIPAGENRTATLSVTVPSNAVGGTIDNMSVTANGNGGSGSASCTAQVTSIRSVNVLISPGSQSGANGAMLNYIVTVYNTGNVSDNYSLTTTDNSGWSRNISPTSLVVAAFSSGNATLTVTVPSNAVGGTADNVKVTATGTGDNGSASCTAQVTIVRSVGVSISPTIMENENGGMLAYTVKVNNAGNVQENFQLVKGDNAGWTLSLDNDWLFVPNGENRITKLNVTIPPDAPVSTRDNIWVQANSQDNTAVFDNKSCLAQVRGIGAEINLVAGWNLVCFAEVGSSDTPNNLFTGLNYYTDYYVYYWSAPNGPYNVQDPNTTFHDNIGYWIWIDQDKTVLTSGSPVASRDVYLVTGWDLVGLPVVNSGTTPDNIFAPLTYYTDYIIYYWSAPSGPYNVQDPDQVFENVLGYWVWINQDRMVTVP